MQHAEHERDDAPRDYKPGRVLGRRRDVVPMRSTLTDYTMTLDAPPESVARFDSALQATHDNIALANHDIYGDALPHRLVQQRAGEAPASDPALVQRAAARGTSGGGGALPHLEAIQAAFGHHDLSGVSAHVGGQAADACDAMGASAYASGSAIAFRGAPDLHTAAHEATHIVQQRAGVALKGGVGAVGDRYEREADRVADLVVRGQSAEHVLDGIAGSGREAAPAAISVQMKAVAPAPSAAAMSDAQIIAELEKRLGRTLDAPERAHVAHRVAERRAAAPAYGATPAKAATPAAPATAPTPAAKNTRQSYDVTAKDKGVIVDANGTSLDPKGFEIVTGRGRGVGNRNDDQLQAVDKNDPNGAQHRPNAKIALSDTKVAKANLDKVNKQVDHKQTYGPLTLTATQAVGHKEGVETETKLKNKGGKTGLSGPSVYAQGGAQNTVALEASAKKEGKAGSATAKASIGSSAEAAYNASAALTNKGATAEATLSVGGDVSTKASGELKSPELKIQGVETALSALLNVGVEGGAFARAGAGLSASLTTEKVGLEGKAGVGAMAEAKATAKAAAGPLAGGVEASIGTGAGAGGDFGVVYENGKLRFGARVWAAMGIGGGVGTNFELDVKQSTELAMAALKQAQALGATGIEHAHRAMDADGNGRINLDDAAHHTARAMNGAAGLTEKAADGVIKTLDGDGDGKFDAKKDLGARAEQLGDGLKSATQAALGQGQALLSKGQETLTGAAQAVAALPGQALEAGKNTAAAVKDAVGDAVERVKDTADVDGDGEVTLSDAKAGATQVAEFAEQKIQAAGEWAERQKEQLVQAGTETMAQAEEALDRNDDGKVDLEDAKVGAAQAMEQGKAAAHSVASSVSQTVGAGVDTAKRTLDGGIAAGQRLVSNGAAAGQRLVNGALATGQQALKSVHQAADRNGDGKVDLADAKAGAEQATHAVTQTVQHVQQEVAQQVEKQVQRAQQAVQRVYQAADLNKDGKVDGKDLNLGAQRAKAAAQQKIAQARAAAKKKASEARAAAQRTYHRTVQQLRQQGQAALRQVQRVQQRAKQVQRRVHRALDRNGDGRLSFRDVRAAAGQARRYVQRRAQQVTRRVVGTAKRAYKAAQTTVRRAASTVKRGFTSAVKRAQGAWNRLTGFFRR